MLPVEAMMIVYVSMKNPLVLNDNLRMKKNYERHFSGLSQRISVICLL